MLNWMVSVLWGVLAAALRLSTLRAGRLDAGSVRPCGRWDAVLRRIVSPRMFDLRPRALVLIPVVADPAPRRADRRRLSRRPDDPPTVPPAWGRNRMT